MPETTEQKNVENNLNQKIHNEQIDTEKTTIENECEIETCEVQSLKDNNIKTTQSTNLFDTLFGDYPRNLPTEPMDFKPPAPRKNYHFVILNTSHLAKRIYLEMMRAVSAYGQLLQIAPQQDKKTIENLQNQMEILSVAMLNIYGKLGERQSVPFMTSYRLPLSKNYDVALQEMYDRVFHIHELVIRLLARTGDQFRSTLIIILTNLKSQLRTLNGLKR